LDEALEIMADLEREAYSPDHWCGPEFLRVKGELSLLCGDESGLASAEQSFLDALDAAGK
jgi:hypothetical protein